MCSIIWNIHCRALHSGGCIATECSTLQLEILLSLRRFHKQKKYTCKNMHLPLTGKITKIERSFEWQTMRPSSPRLIKAQCVPFWSRMSLIFHINITESVYPHFTLWVVTPRDLQLVIIHGWIELVQSKTSRVNAISSREKIFKSAF